MVDLESNNPAAERLKSMSPFEELRKMQAEMVDKCNIEYWLMDLITPNYDKIRESVAGKRVLFNASNIFSYHISHAYYTLDQLVNSYYKLIETLSYADECWFQGTKPTKQWVRKWI